MNANDYLNMFRKCETQDDARSLYRKIAQEAHPDKHPQEESDRWTEEFKQLAAGYADYMSHYARTDARRRQEEAHTNNRKTQADYNDVDSLYEEWKKVVEACLMLDGVKVEIIGLWVWVTGDTKPHKETLKSLGFKWAHKKDDLSAWFNPMNVKSFSHGGYTLDDIRGLHGSTKYTRKTNTRKDEEKEETAPAFIPANATA